VSDFTPPAVNPETEAIMDSQRKVMNRMHYIARRVYELVRQNGHFYGDEHDIFVTILNAELEHAGQIATKETLEGSKL
jgi:hypothetical protein